MDAAVILVAHDRWFLESVGNSVLELGEGRPKFFCRPMARVADREGAPRALPGARREAPRGRHRPARALRRALPRQEHAGDAREVEAEADRPHQARRAAARPLGVEVACVLVRRGAALGQGRARDGGRDDRRRVEAAVRGRGALGRVGRARLPDRPQRLGQVHPDLDPRRRERARLRVA